MTDTPDQAPVNDRAMDLAEEEERNSTKVTLADYCAKGTAAFAQKHYVEAVDYYAQASEIQAQLNGDMDPQNADILFLYGRALFKVGQSKSDVLGGNAPANTKKSNGKTTEKKPKKIGQNGGGSAVEGATSTSEQLSEGAKPENGEQKPLFQFTGDENLEDSESDDAEGNEDDDEEGPEDELESAFEILEVARVLFTRRLEAPREDEESTENDDSTMVTHIKERLADTHDLLAEISLENERFPGAVSDFRSSLKYKVDLYPEESNLVAEAHFKLSLALEFASLTRSKDEEQGEGKEGAAEDTFDQAMRDEAVQELEAAIKSSNLKLQMKEVELASTSSPDDNDLTRAQITDVKEMVADMETRLKDLKAPPIDVRSALYGPAGIANDTPATGVLGATVGETPEVAAARIEEAAKNATDLTGMVRKKVKAETESTTATTGSKRKAEDDEEGQGNESPKKAKVDDADDE